VLLKIRRVSTWDVKPSLHPNLHIIRPHIIPLAIVIDFKLYLHLPTGLRDELASQTAAAPFCVAWQAIHQYGVFKFRNQVVGRQ